jgi:RNA polymerase sigma-70 factor (ECF subfamily)
MTELISQGGAGSRDQLYAEATRLYGAALVRLARSYEADPDLAQDLLQEIHLALWRSLDRFDGRCSLRTWVYRIAHNAAASHLIKSRTRRWRRLESIDSLDAGSELVADVDAVDRQLELAALMALVQELKPLDRQIMVLYLEGLDAASTAEIVGITAGNVATKVHRLKRILAARAASGEGGGRHER